jgi:hypothetical protein
MVKDERAWTHETRSAVEVDETLETLCPSCGREWRVWTENGGEGDTSEGRQHRHCDVPPFRARASATWLLSGLAQILSRAKAC